MANRVDADLAQINQASFKTKQVYQKLKENSDSVVTTLNGIDGLFEGSAGDQVRHYRKVLHAEVSSVSKHLDRISQSLAQTAENYGDSDRASAENISAQGNLADLLRGATGAISGIGEGIGGSSGGNATSTGAIPPFPSGGSEQEMYDWWDSLSPQQQEQYLASLADDPAALAEFAWADGLPADARHEANMMILESYVLATNDPSAASLLERINTSGESHPDDQLMLLGFQPPGPDSEALVVVSSGNPDEAVNTGVYVPGTTASLDSISGDIDRAELLRATTEGVSGEDTAMVMWLGYEAPPEVFNTSSLNPFDFRGGDDATNPRYAEAGAENLYNFMTGLDVADQHNGNGTTTVLGHSYGSTMVGHGASYGDDFRADNIIAVGSPGMGVSSADELGVDNVYAMTTRNDVIMGTPPGVHGPQPGSNGFGAESLASSGADGHSGYWEENSQSLLNQAYVMGGMEDQVTNGSASLRGHTGDVISETATGARDWAYDRASDAGGWMSDRASDVGDWFSNRNPFG
ncbi:alpha/beta hydrolase [Natronoglycomyces albus]|uniref:DUF1023 domain-containing protein n=1 Tax=Natronoglycomyces albus TaxID=2811108 RepID=A0A895XLP0_9ACTN|nr:alpha/beta hydrolase [Natronoglycomyces albus]QSB05997.1 hypothetical protein JQS30_03475 [Natronoglycomyces albus]